MCFSSLVLSRRPKTLKKRPQTLKNPLTPIGSCRELHILVSKARCILVSSLVEVRGTPHSDIRHFFQNFGLFFRGFLRVWGRF